LFISDAIFASSENSLVIFVAAFATDSLTPESIKTFLKSPSSQSDTTLFKLAPMSPPFP